MQKKKNLAKIEFTQNRKEILLIMKSNSLTYEYQEQLSIQPEIGCLTQRAGLERFQQTGFGCTAVLYDTSTFVEIDTEEALEKCRHEHPDAEFSWGTSMVYSGELQDCEDDLICPHCGAAMASKGYEEITLKHAVSGKHRSEIRVRRHRFRCPCCGRQTSADIPFQAEGHRITVHLEQDIEWYCRLGLAHTEIQQITGIHRHIIKDIDKRRLEELYRDGDNLRKPEHQARFLGVDEFSLHKGRYYATQIMDMETGHVLFLAEGKKKAVIYQFIDYVGLHWMAGVKAVCCDMNADFASAFLDKCPHLEIVYDRFHLVKNYNQMVLDEIRKDVQRDLQKEGDKEGAKSLKRSKYILCSKRTTLQESDRKAEKRRAERAASGEDTAKDKKRKGREERYDEIIALNELFFIADYIKEALNAAYQQTSREVMEDDIREIIALCRATGNDHFGKFANLLENHLDGITAHALYPRTSGKVEGMNNKIKTIRRRSYGFADTEFFFLKIMDASRRRSA